MIITRYKNGSMKLHFVDEDNYNVTEDNGVDVWIGKDEIKRITEMSK
jgi:hypothetical protein